MESEQIDTGVIERCILDCNATRLALKDWEERRDDDDFLNVIAIYSRESVATVRELKELRTIWETISVVQKAQIEVLEERVKQQEEELGLQTQEPSTPIEGLKKGVMQQEEELKSETGEILSLSESLTQVKESLKKLAESLRANGKEIQGLDEICRGLRRLKQDDETNVGHQSKEQEAEAEAARLKEQVERLKSEKADFEEQLAREKLALARAREELKDKLTVLAMSEEKVQGLESEVGKKAEALMAESRALHEKEEELRVSRRV